MKYYCFIFTALFWALAVEEVENFKHVNWMDERGGFSVLPLCGLNGQLQSPTFPQPADSHHTMLHV